MQFLNDISKSYRRRLLVVGYRLLITAQEVKDFRNLSLLILLIIFFLPIFSFSQNRNELEAQRKQLYKDIRLTTTLLNETKINREATLEYYLTLQTQIKKRKLLINTLQKEINLLTKSISQNTKDIEEMTEDLEQLKEEYSQLLRSAYRQKLNQSDLLFLFSAGSFNEVYRRWKYLKQYDSYRQKQGRLILERQDTLNERNATLDSIKIQKQKQLKSVERQAFLMEHEIQEKNAILKNLEEDEAKLATKLSGQEHRALELTNVIEKIIREEIAKKRRNERNNAAFPNTEREVAPAERLSDAFYQNKGKLPWPVKNGVITGKFGRQPHPTIKTIEITNNGIDIQTDKNADVRAVFEGKVAGIQFVPGYDYMIIIRHGNYYTVYSNLQEVFVKNGEKVKLRAPIGKVSTDPRTNTSEVHFEVWKEKTRLNPSSWVSKR